MKTEQWIQKLENESKALKASFERSANSIPIITKTASFTTSANDITTNYPGFPGYPQPGPERVIVTFDTVTGTETLAVLEMTHDYTDGFQPVVRMVPYSNGAKWIVTNDADYLGDGATKRVAYNFVVLSLIDGAVSVAETTS